jgi:predicted nucleotidyltransferase
MTETPFDGAPPEPPPIDADTERAARAFIERVSAHYDLAGAVLFGSRARRSHRPDSDADIAVLLRGPSQPFLDTKLDLADIAFEVLLDTGVLIQPLPIWEDEWEHPEHHRAPALIRNVHREGVRL